MWTTATSGGLLGISFFRGNISVQISGLSNQWQTREGLLDSLGTTPHSLGRTPRGEAMRQLLLHLEGLDGPPIWAGTSHSQLNLVTRDTIKKFDRVPPFAYIDTYEAKGISQGMVSRIRTREVMGSRPTNTWISREVDDIQSAANLIMDALKFADSPQRNSNRVWVFCGKGSQLPAGIFSTRNSAIQWMKINHLTGTLFEFPLNEGAYDNALRSGMFTPLEPHEREPSFIADFRPRLHCEGWVNGKPDWPS